MKKKNNKILMIGIIFLIIILLGVLDVVYDFAGKKHGDFISVNVEEGESLSSVAEKLEEKGVIRYKFLFIKYAVNKNADTSLKAGKHIVYKKMGYKRAIEELVAYGTGINTVAFTVPEGYELAQIAKSVKEVFGIPEEDFIRAAKKDYDMLSVNPDVKRRKTLEGYLFPDTYEFFLDATAEDIVFKMLSKFENIWTPEYDKRRKELGMSMDEVIILASIIEREAGSVSEMGKVSSVFHNRLKIGMALQSCATVQYILEERKDVLSISDTKIDSPYNTYLYPGLPEGPIANPGKAAIEAALYPENTEYYYFKVNDNGVTVFSKTRAEHDAK